VKISFQAQGQVYTLDLVQTQQGYQVQIDGRSVEVQVVKVEPGVFYLEIEGRPATIYWAREGPQRWISYRGRTVLVDKRTSLSRRPEEVGTENRLRAPMPGQVRSTKVAAGDPVIKGQTLLLLEAMKMEIRIQAPCDGQVARLAVQEGDTVEQGQLLVEINV
jgi:biotin carboxyl carrier protein